SGLIRISDSSCGSPGATKDITATHGPNGNIDWFNCGVDGSGWRPPMVTVDDIVTVDLDDAVKQSGSPFKACEPYISTFKKYANEHGLPPILIASIAMQESTCNPHTVGGGGEQGLMQITKDKCGGAPGGNCQDVDFNIKTGTAFFASVLKDNGGSLLKTIGNYNGWPSGMTIGSATAARHSQCCLCQNNLDYLQQTMNGWLLNKDPYANHMGKYFNLDDCPGR
ncbi:lysozyme-like protein, partial [Lentinus tigrinus ALCF2SS1-7]|uniref:lysozyme-like protein n=1 Tax=Lentinus tigrinus ALCF2SS1-7 TaxID=1328758 RepID=UPI001165F99E